MAKKGSITIKELHARTGAYVRQAGRARIPLRVTDRGKVVASLGPPHAPAARERRRTVLPEYAAFLTRSKRTDVLRDLEAIRSDR
jgi:hypothetical protein